MVFCKLKAIRKCDESQTFRKLTTLPDTKKKKNTKQLSAEEYKD